MATKTKKKKQTKSIKKTSAKKSAPGKAIKKKSLARKPAPKKKPAKKRPAAKQATAGKRLRKAVSNAASKRPTRQKAEVTLDVSPDARQVRANDGAGDLQGLSNTASVDSESVDELLDEGNAFEAEVVKGVQDAGDADEEEVHTHEVPEDDVPGEYLDEK